MPALRELQRDIVAVMLNRAEPATLVCHLQPAIDLARRIGVYRVNTRENFATALEAAFPVLAGQMGGTEFRRMAWSYQRHHPSPSGNLFETGRALPGFLAKALAGSVDAWLAELARLEWAVQEAMTAADSGEQFDPAVIAGMAAEARSQLRLVLHPSVRLLALDYPCFDSWRSHQQGGRADAPARACAEHLLVRRASDGVELHRLDPAGFLCLSRLAAGATLAEAMAALEYQAGAAAVAAGLARWAADDIIIGTLCPPSTGEPATLPGDGPGGNR